MNGIRDRWRRGFHEGAGVAEPFKKRLECSEAMSTDLASLVLELPRQLSELLRSHVHIMGNVSTMVKGGGEAQALMAIYLLRSGTVFTDLCAKTDLFMAAASLVHEAQQAELVAGVRTGAAIPGQTAAVQRLYLKSFRDFEELRRSIVADWGELTLKVDSAVLFENMRRTSDEQIAAMMRLSWMGGDSLLALPAAAPMAPVLAIADEARDGGPRIEEVPEDASA